MTDIVGPDRVPFKGLLPVSGDETLFSFHGQAGVVR
jgi:hypothetical protein